MDIEKIKKIIHKYQEGTASETEKQVLYNWYNQYGKSKKRTALPQDMWIRQLSSLDLILKNAENSKSSISGSVFSIPRGYYKIIAAAAVLLILGISLYYHYHSPLRVNTACTALQDVNPGTDGATLTLGNGKQIQINDSMGGEIFSEEGIRISKDREGQIVYEINPSQSQTASYNEISTTRGQQIKIKLVDGTLVYLNAASSLRFPTSFDQVSNREVFLTGESYFEVAKNPDLPFIVSTPKQKVLVLGTHFNIKAYAEEEPEVTTLLEGSVSVSAGNTNVKLKPGEQAINKDNTLRVSKVNVQNAVDWKDGDFYFENTPIHEVLNKISRWYNVDVAYESTLPSDLTSNGLISRDKKLSEVLRSIEMAGNIKLRIEGSRIIVSNR